LTTLNITPSHVAIWTPISTTSAVSAELTTMTDRQTDQPRDRSRYSICNNRPDLASAAVWPEK